MGFRSEFTISASRCSNFLSWMTQFSTLCGASQLPHCRVQLMGCLFCVFWIGDTHGCKFGMSYVFRISVTFAQVRKNTWHICVCMSNNEASRHDLLLTDGILNIYHKHNFFKWRFQWLLLSCFLPAFVHQRFTCVSWCEINNRYSVIFKILKFVLWMWNHPVHKGLIY